MEKERFNINNIPAILYGSKSDKLYLVVHGRYSKKEEADNFAHVATSNGYQVLSFDLPEHGDRKQDPYKCTVQNGVQDLDTVYSSIKSNYKSISLYACSLGAYFSLVAYKNIAFEHCLFVSPILNMEKLIQNMMLWANTTEDELRLKKEINTSFGETLSWDYYQYVRMHPIDQWNNRTSILYGGNDNLTEKTVLDSFSEKFNCTVDIMNDGEHYFHTPEQLEHLDNWIRKSM